MTKLCCVHCGARFIPAPQVPNQAYCSKANCQKERRRQWQKNKLLSDPDYRDNQSRAQKAWTEKNPDYWRQYRQGGLDYGKPQPSEQDTSALEPQNSPVKMDSLTPHQISRTALQDGIFRLKVLSKPNGVKMGVWIVELSIIHAGSRPIARRVKR